MTKAIFSTSYLPSIEYIQTLWKFSSVKIEQYENFPKQTARNRCHILSANGIQTITIPVLHEHKVKVLIRDLKISYHEPWQRVHWQALCSAYNKSPFYEFYRDDFEKIIFSNKTFLLDLNTELLQLILRILKVNAEIGKTGTYEEGYPENDFRFLSNGKSNSINNQQSTINNQQYLQVFSYKFGFVPNLSIVDLIFNTGNAAPDFVYSELNTDC
ncbi:MAG: WbqC family protein [Bacteroidia bacterium]